MFKLLIPILFLSGYLNSQSTTKEIEVLINEHNQMYFIHKMEASETLFSLCRYYKTKMEDVLLINNIKELDNIPIGSEITFPFNVNGMVTTPKKDDRSWGKVTYKVRQRETLYKIANSYFPQKIENLFSRNRIRSFSLKRGQKLIVGWWDGSAETQTKKSKILATLDAKKKEDKIIEAPITETPKVEERIESIEPDNSPDPISEPTTPQIEDAEINELEDKQRELEDLIARLKKKKQEIEEDRANNPEPIVNTENTPPDSVILNETDILTPQDSLLVEIPEEPEVIEEPQSLSYSAGLAYWEKDEIDRTNLFVMHSEAKPGSYIKLAYELTGQEVTAKVICPIPKGLYPDEIDIIISPGVAIALGALDSPFQIEMHYYE